MTKRGRPLQGTSPLSSTDRGRSARRRAAEKSRAYEVFASVVRMEADSAGFRGGQVTDRQARLIAGRDVMNLVWLDNRLADLDAAADFFKMDAFGRLPSERRE